MLADHEPLEHLNPFLLAFRHPHVHANGVARPDVGPLDELVLLHRFDGLHASALLIDSRA